MSRFTSVDEKTDLNNHLFYANQTKLPMVFSGFDIII